MKKTVFYSWQSDLPNSSNRSLIEKALTKAVKAISDDDEIEVEPVIDRDTAGVGGSPDISATIFSKIEDADVFVADVSIINKDSIGRKVPNPNVLIELGYALKVLGHNNVVLVMNTKFGGIELLPFDLRTKRILTYNTSQEKKRQTEEIAGKLKSQLKVIFETKISQQDTEPSVIDLIKNQKPDRVPGVRSYMKSLSKDIDTLYPGDGMLDVSTADPEYDQKIMDALEDSQDLVSSFRSVVDEIAVFEDADSLKEVFNGFKPILEGFERRKNDKDGMHHTARHDYYRFLGNELFVILVSILLREEKWDLLKSVLEGSIVIDNVDGYKPEVVDFTYFSEQVLCFQHRKQRLKSNRISLRYDLLVERRKLEEEHIPSAVEEYTSADLFLFLKGETGKINTTDTLFNWRPWSLLSFELPRFILLAKQKNYAKNIANALNVPHAQDVQILLQNKLPSLDKFSGSIFRDNPINTEHIEQIGSR